MSEIEAKEFADRMAALTKEEQIIAARFIDDNIMFAELMKRSSKRQAIISMVTQMVGKAGE